MLDKYKRQINYLRISVTDKCNLRCRYCMPEDGISLLQHKDVLSFEEIADVVLCGIDNGINKIRITGGEPLIRRGIVDLVRIIGEIKGIEELAMTTNALLLDKYAQPLYEAGLNRVNISLDTIDPQKYRYITRGGDINKVFKGIQAARQAGLDPIKINCVVLNSSDEEDARAVAEYCQKNDLNIRYIHRMDLRTGEFSVVEGGEGGDCNKCNRLRLTANGMIKPCLFSDLEFKIRELGIQQAIQQAVATKPECGTISLKNRFHNIGG